MAAPNVTAGSISRQGSGTSFDFSGMAPSYSNGDLLFIFLTNLNTNGFTKPSGWDVVAEWESYYNLYNHAVYSRVSDGSATDEPTVTCPDSSTAGFMAAVSGADSVGNVATVGHDSADPFTIGNISITDDDSLLLLANMSELGYNNTTLPDLSGDGYTNILDGQTGTDYQIVLYGGDFNTGTDGGATLDYDGSALRAGTIVFAINPAAGGTTVTGTGALAAQSSTASGVGEREVTGTGTPSAQGATASGVGEREVTGSGTPAAQDASISGLGARSITGLGNIQAEQPIVSGLGERAITGTGNAQSQAPTVSGTGERAITGTGSPQAGSASVDGEGTIIGPITGSGTLTAQDASTTGVGARTITGSGSPVAQESTASGVGGRVITGEGTPTAQESQISGVGGSGVSGSGNAQAQDASIIGAGERSITGQGMPSAQAATVTGTGKKTSTGIGALVAAAASIVGVAVRSIFGSGSLQAEDSTVSGDDAEIVVLPPVAASRTKPNTQGEGSGRGRNVSSMGRRNTSTAGAVKYPPWSRCCNPG